MTSSRQIFLVLSFLLTSHFARSIDVSLQIYAFRGPEKPYLEMSIYILGKSVSPFVVDSLKQGRVEVLMTCQKQGIIVIADKYILNSPLAGEISDFLDVRRYAVDTGYYRVTYEFRDLADTLNTTSVGGDIEVVFTGSGLEQSDIQLLSSIKKSGGNEHLVKNGVYMEPLPFDYYHRDLDQLIVYHEVYGLSGLPEDRYYTTMSISTQERPETAVLETHKLLKQEQTFPLLKQVDIRDLPSGNYVLRVSIHNSKREELSSRECRFQRSNPERDVRAFGETARSTLSKSFTNDIPDDSLVYCLRAIAPVVSSIDNEVLNYVIKQGSDESKRFFLHRYWTSKNMAQPKSVFEAYMKVARAIDKMYRSGFGFGFETDRGHIYMKYGRPDDVITVLDEQSAPPYEIWYYNQFEATHQANVRFLFYNPSLADNDFILLHSTAIGERSNPRWEIELYGSAPNQIEGSDYIGGTRMQDNFFRNARRYFEGN